MSDNSSPVTAILIAVLIVLIIVLVAGGLFVMFMSYTDKVFKQVFRRPKPQPQVDRSPTKIDRSTIIGRGKNWFYTFHNEWLGVRTTSFDGCKLSGYYRPSSDSTCRNMVILVHGYDESPAEMAAYARLMMRKVQCHCIITHMRGHGMSGGKNFTWGLMESVDLDAWFAFTKRRLGNNCRIYLVSRGAGATACLLAAQQQGFDSNVVGIIADSPVASLTSFLKNSLSKSTKISPDAIIARIRKLAQKNFGFDINRCDATDHASSIKVPVLIFQGGEDDVTVPSGSRDIYDGLRSRKRMVIVNNAKHLECYEKSQAMYEREVQKFIESCIVRLVKIGRL
ncbi:MAG: lysophospholipase [Saccharofermentans sp.]|nr:lysophospholipase [Saccharofermentans sp.]